MTHEQIEKHLQALNATKTDQVGKTYSDGWFEAMKRIHSAFQENPRLTAFDLAQIASDERNAKGTPR